VGWGGHMRSGRVGGGGGGGGGGEDSNAILRGALHREEFLNVKRGGT